MKRVYSLFHSLKKAKIYDFEWLTYALLLGDYESRLADFFIICLFICLFVFSYKMGQEMCFLKNVTLWI